MNARVYEPTRDRPAVQRIWRECGWMRDDAQHAGLDTLLASGVTWVADVDGEAECLALTQAGSMRYLDGDLPFSLVSAVITGRAGRQQGLAGRLTAQAVAAAAAEGAAVAGLGMFEQGFYDRLGFGSGPYEHLFLFDPGDLRVPGGVRARVPRRLTPADAPAMHANRMTRRRRHGSCTLVNPAVTCGQASWDKDAFGLGYFDDDGTLTHHFWCVPAGEWGPYRIRWLCGRTTAEIIELFALLHAQSDQIRQLRIEEPPGLQLQDLIHRPIRRRITTSGAPLGQEFRFLSWWQMRINDLPRCLAATPLRSSQSLRFNLELSDPIAERLPADAPWRGVGGSYVVALGAASGAEAGTDPALPTLRTTVNKFSRLWLGVAPASGLAITTGLDAPEDLIAALDETLREVPVPRPDWEF